MKPPPPRLPARGRVTARAKPTATAASTTLPPAFKTSTPTWLASRCADTTMPWSAATGAGAAPAGPAPQSAITAVTHALNRIRHPPAAYPAAPAGGRPD